MRVAIIGAGNVASHLVLALRKANIDVPAIWARSTAKATPLAEQTGVKLAQSISELISLNPDIILIAIKDDAIAEIADKLIDYKGLVAHSSGAVALNALATCKNYGVFYPLQTFSKNRIINFAEVPICLEANNATNLGILTQLAQALGCRSYQITSEKRSFLHLAAVFACNFPNYLYGIAEELLRKEQISFELLRPLILETANKVMDALPKAVQTGPAIRADQETMQKHEQMLLTDQEKLKIYQLLSKGIQQGSED